MASDSGALIRSSALLPVIASLRSNVLGRLLPRFRPAWQNELDRLRQVAEGSGDVSRARFLARISDTPDEAAGLENEVGRSVRGRALESVWGEVRDLFGSELEALIGQLSPAVQDARAQLSDVEKGLKRSDEGALSLLKEDSRVELGDLHKVAALNWTDIGPHLDAARSILKVGEALLAAEQKSRFDVHGEDRSAARGLFLQRAAALLSFGHGERVCELIDESIRKERAAAARVVQYRRARRESRIAEKLKASRRPVAGSRATVPEGSQLAADVVAAILPVIVNETRAVFAAELALFAKRIEAAPVAPPQVQKPSSEAAKAEVSSKPIGKLTSQEADQVDSVLCQILNDRQGVTLAEFLEALKKEPRAPWCRSWTLSAFKAALQGRTKRGSSRVHTYRSKFPRAKSKWDELHGV